VPDYTNPQALNRNSYVLNNPMKYTDPTGHIADCGGCELLGYYYWYASLSPEEQWITTAYLNMLPSGSTATASCFLGCCDAACQAQEQQTREELKCCVLVGVGTVHTGAGAGGEGFCGLAGDTHGGGSRSFCGLGAGGVGGASVGADIGFLVGMGDVTGVGGTGFDTSICAHLIVGGCLVGSFGEGFAVGGVSLGVGMGIILNSGFATYSWTFPPPWDWWP
jgi:hypothetical protein